MAKSTVEEAAITRQKIIDAAMEITLSDGFESATLGNIAKKVGISRSGVNCHFAKKVDIARAIEPSIIQAIHSTIDFRSCETFSKTWIDAINTNQMFRGCISSLGAVIPPDEGFDSMVKLIEDDSSRGEKESIVYQCIGYALVEIQRLSKHQ